MRVSVIGGEVTEEPLKEILSINNIDKETADNVLKLRYHFIKITGVHYSKSSKIERNTILIF